MSSWEYFADFFGEYYTIFIVCICHTSFFFLSVAFSWPSPALAKLSRTEDNPLGNPITSEESDLIGSILFVVASIGPLLFIPTVNKYGRKNILAFLLCIVPVAFSLLIFGKIVELYYSSRVLLGVYVGATLSIVPVYLSEIIGSEDFAFLMSFEIIFGFAGIFITYVLIPFVPLNYFNGGIVVISSIVVMLLMFGCPDSPYYVMRNYGKDEARKVLRSLRKKYVEKELDIMEKTVAKEGSKSHLEIFKSKKYLKTFVLATTPILSAQFCGITVIVAYSQLIFLETNLSIPSHICSIIVAGLLQFTAPLGPTIIKSKKLSLKTITTFCLSGLGLCNLAISLYFFYGKYVESLNWVPLAGLVLFVVIFNCGFEPIAWTILGVTYPKNVNCIGTALSTSVYFISVFPILYSFYKVDIGFLFFSSFVTCTLGVLYCRFVFEEPITEDVHQQTALI